MTSLDESKEYITNRISEWEEIWDEAVVGYADRCRKVEESFDAVRKERMYIIELLNKSGLRDAGLDGLSTATLKVLLAASSEVDLTPQEERRRFVVIVDAPVSVSDHSLHSALEHGTAGEALSTALNAEVKLSLSPVERA